MKRYLLQIALFGCLTAGAHSAASAQIFTPGYLPPAGGPEVGIFVSDGPGDIAVEAIWRRNIDAGRFGLRGGIAEGAELSAIVGADFSWPLLDATPIQIAPTAMAQATLGEAEGLGVGGGLSLAIPLGDADFSILPFFHPSIVFYDGFGQDNGSFELIGDLGVRLGILPNYALTVAAGLNRPGADWGVGISRR